MVEPKKSIQSLEPYINGNHSQYLIKNHLKIFKLDSNEATIGPSPRVIGKIIQYIQEGPINWYPDVDSVDLRDSISHYTQIPTEYILTFNGSDHALETIARAYLNIDDEVIYFQPTYDHFRVYAESCDAVLVPVDENIADNFISKIETAITSKTKIIYLVNPNNPTGAIIAHEQIQQAVIKYPQVVFVIDEAYFEFCDLTVADLVIDNPNLMVTRSFSKAFGLAALRCGYLIAHPSALQQISKIRVGKNINGIAQVAATAALEDIDYMKRYVEDVNTAKQWTIQQLQSKNVQVKTTPANFILIKVKEPIKILNYLESQNIYIRDRSMIPQLKGFIRLTIGDLLVMKRFWKVFQEVPKEWLNFSEVPLKQKSSP